jgi:hypothetical protein
LRYAAERGWQFKLITEREIRTDYLTNVQFLRQYTGSHVQVVQADQDLLLNLLRDVGLTIGEELLRKAASDRIRRAELLYALWQLIAAGQIRCDLTNILTLQSELWIP